MHADNDIGEPKAWGPYEDDECKLGSIDDNEFIFKNAKQLDQSHRDSSSPARNPQSQSRQQQGQTQQEQPYSNIFNVDRETAEKLQGQTDQRGHIINVEQLSGHRKPDKSKNKNNNRVDVEVDINAHNLV
ncbi:hypothetical protein L1887_09261 [Cichorium endivia]|nr:hypothetical protein L1887_09261 [Cichorium endivia]